MASEPGNGTPELSRDPPEFSWRGTQALRRVHALNERCLELLAQLACSNRSPSHLAIINQHRELWSQLNAAPRKRAARTPFLLVDVRFQDAPWWRLAKDPRLSRRSRIVTREAFTGKTAGELMRETLMLAWSTVAFERAGASILFGMTPAVSSIIAELGPQDVERIAARHSRYLQPRWEEYPAFWGRLLTASIEGDEETLHEIHLHGVQLIGSELLPLLDGSFA